MGSSHSRSHRPYHDPSRRDAHPSDWGRRTVYLASQRLEGVEPGSRLIREYQARSMETFIWGGGTTTAGTMPADMVEAVERVIGAKAVMAELGTAEAGMAKAGMATAAERVIMATALVEGVGTAGVYLGSIEGMGVREDLWAGKSMRNWTGDENEIRECVARVLEVWSS